MATNPYFSRFFDDSSPEVSLQEQLLIEYIQMDGVDTIYLPKVLLTEDTVLNEIVHSYHSQGMMIEMLPEEYQDYENNSMELSKFGMSALPNEATFIVSRSRFAECVANERLRVDDRPNEGDLIYIPAIQEMFVIRKVKKPNPYIAKDRWELMCEKYEEQNSISIDLSDNMHHTGGVFDTAFDNGIGDFIPINDDIENLVKTLEGDCGEATECEFLPDPEKNIFENQADRSQIISDQCKSDGMDNVRKNTNETGKNDIYEMDGDDLIVRDASDPHIKSF